MIKKIDCGKIILIYSQEVREWRVIRKKWKEEKIFQEIGQE